MKNKCFSLRFRIQTAGKLPGFKPSTSTVAWVTVGKLLKLPIPQFPCPKYGEHNTYLGEVRRGLYLLIQVKTIR